MTDSTNLIRLIKEIQPDEIYNLAAMSHVAVSFELPEYTANTDGIGTLRILEAVRLLGLESKIQLVDTIMFEHHYDNMIKKNYNFTNIHSLLINNNFKKIYKSKMPFRKTFEYIYIKNGN
jgi:GDP-D-mannose dehydratase